MQKENIKCPNCRSSKIKECKQYKTKLNDIRELNCCEDCGALFSETHSTFLFCIKKPIYLITFVLKALTDGMGINACCRTFNISKNTIYSWLEKSAEIKKVLFFKCFVSPIYRYVNRG